MADKTDPSPPASPVRANSIGRFAVVLIILAVVTGLFAYAGGWLSPNAITPSKFIDTFEQVNGEHPGFRRNHAKGVGFSGSFESTGNAAALSRAVVFQPGHSAVIGRFALAGGMPFQADAPHTVRSMAIQIKTSDGQEWRSGMNNIPVFPASTPKAFYDLLIASAPDPKTGKPDPAKMGPFLAQNPASAKAFQLIQADSPTSGFGDSTYNSLDAFVLIDSTGKRTAVRWAMVPNQTVKPVPTTQPVDADPNYLFDGLIAAVKQHPLQWHLMITVAQPGDPTRDPSLPWPADRQRIDAGTLTVDRIEGEETSPARDINFDPLVLPAGITGSDDPMLSARSAAYAQSFTRREGEKKTPSQVSTTGKAK